MRSCVFVGLTLLLVMATFYLPFVWSVESYKVVVRALDKDDAPLSGAWVKITTQYDVDDLRSQEKQTNASGFAVFDQIVSSLSSAEVRIYWRGAIVTYQTVALSSGTNEFTFYCNVSSLTVLVVDDNDVPLKTAKVTISWITDVTYSETASTDSEGAAVFSQMPHIDYEVSVRWQNLKVHEGTFGLTGSTSIYKARCRVFSLAVHVMNRRNQNLQGSTVTVTHAEAEWSLLNKTETNGVAVFAQVPSGNYSIRAVYQATSNITAISVTQNTEVSLKLNITGKFEVTIQVEWSDGEPVSKAIVTVQNSYGQQLLSEVTNENGTLKTTLSEGAYTVKVIKNTLSKTQNITVTNRTLVHVTFDASFRTYTLTIKVIDETGSSVDNAAVEIYQNGKLIHSSQTTQGIAVFNLKQGTYNVIAKLGDKQREKIVEVKADTTVTISFYENNKIRLLLTYTMIPVLIIASAGLLFLYYFKRKNRLF
jgi:hypothetical protein